MHSTRCCGERDILTVLHIPQLASSSLYFCPLVSCSLLHTFPESFPPSLSVSLSLSLCLSFPSSLNLSAAFVCSRSPLSSLSHQVPGVQQFIAKEQSQKFIEPPPFDMKQCFADSKCYTPLIFVLTPGESNFGNIINLTES